MESWQIFHYARKVLPNDVMFSIYSRSYPLITRWASNPAYCSEHARNPIDRLKIMLEELDRAGYGKVARAAVDLFAASLGGTFQDAQPIKSDKGTVDGEAADAIMALGELVKHVREALEDNKVEAHERAEILEAARAVNREIAELLDAAKV